MATWLRVFAAPGSDASVLCIDNGTNFKRLEIQSGTTRLVYFSGGNNTQAITLVLNQWYYVACADDATRGYMFIIDPSILGVGLFQCASTGPDVPTAVNIGGDQEGETASFDMYKPRIWDGVLLTPDQIFGESNSLSPVHTANLNSSFDFEVNTDILVDTSGNGRNMTNPGGAGVWQTQTSPTLGQRITAINTGLPIRAGIPTMSGGTNTDAGVAVGAFDFQMRGGNSWFDDVALDPAQFDHDVVLFGASFTGTGAATFGAMTGSAAGSSTTGTGAPNFAAMTGSASGALGVAGTAAATFAAMLGAASGALGVAGTGAISFLPMTGSGAGAQGPVGLGAATFAPMAGLGAGSSTVGSGAALFGVMTGSAAGGLGASGVGASTFAAMLAAGAGAVGAAGDASSTFAPMTGDATAAVAILGVGDATWGAMLGSGFGNVLPRPAFNTFDGLVVKVLSERVVRFVEPELEVEPAKGAQASVVVLHQRR